MDKYEYKVRADEIKELIAAGEYSQAVDIADTIDWRRVKSVMMLCTISDLYKISRRYEDAKNMLLLAYERRPWGKTICYSLCELYIKTGELSQAANYYKEFVQAAPKDPGRYVLQYKLCEAWDVSLEERISVLEELKQRDYRDKWAYELAYLYHRIGLATRCVEECDELIVWFGEGKYVIKAMELKMLHQPLSASQQEKYDHRFDPVRKAVEEIGRSGGTVDPVPVGETGERTDWTAAVLDVRGGQPGAEPVMEEAVLESGFAAEAKQPPAAAEEASAGWTAQGAAVSSDTRTDWVLSTPKQEVRQEAVIAPGSQSTSEEPEIQVKTMDVGAYNTINLQAEIAAGLQEVLAEDDSQTDAITRSIIAPLLESNTENIEIPQTEAADGNGPEPEREVMEGSEVFFSETGDLGGEKQEETQAVSQGFMREEAVGLIPQEAAPTAQEGLLRRETVQERLLPAETSPETLVQAESAQTQLHSDETADIVMRQMRMENMLRRIEQALMIQPPKELAGVLSQESDGQISLVVPETEEIEKQITGQMNLEDILNEWERLKRENEAKRQEEVRQHVLEQTGNMFTEFEKSVKGGLLERLENEPVDLEGFTELEIEPEEEGQESEELTELEIETLEPESGAQEEAEGAQEAEEFGEPEEFAGSETEAVEEEPLDGEPSEESQEESGAQEAEEPAGPEAEPLTEEAVGEEAEQEGLEDPADPETEVVEKEPEEETAEESQEQEEAEGTQEGEEQEEPIESEAETPEPESGEQEEAAPAKREKAAVRALTREEKELYAPFIQSRSGRERLVKAIDSISMAAYTGNVIITGERGMDTLSLAKNMVREIQMTDSNFSGKIAKISGQGLNSKNIEETLGRLESGALIVQEASGMEESTLEAMQKALQKENFGIIIFLEDTKKAIDKMLAAYPKLRESFTARMDVETMSNGSLVSFGRQYAREMEYSIDELGVLALHTRIEERQTLDHAVTVMEVKDIVDAAIRHANRKTMGHFFDILFARRYDEEDMIILTEKDFV